MRATQSFRWMLGSVAGMAAVAASAQSLVVHKIADRFDGTTWRAGGYNRAGGEVRLVDDAAPGREPRRCLEMAVAFSGEGFEFFSAEPIAPLVIPGSVRSVTLQAKRSSADYGLTLEFRDGWNRGKVDGKDLKLDVRFTRVGEWEPIALRIPDNWVRPVRVASASTHNWSKENQSAKVSFFLGQLDVETDLENVDAETGVLRTWTPNPTPDKDTPASVWRTPLIRVQVGTAEQSNVFSREKPELSVHVAHWLPGTLRGEIRVAVSSDDGAPQGEEARTFEADGPALVTVPLKVAGFGRYHAEVRVRFADGREQVERLTFATVPPWRERTDAQKDASPYGVNVHGGGTTQPFVPFRKAGLVWFRDYAFGHEVMAAANKDRQWGGWPWYPRLLKTYADLGLRVMPCMMNSLSRAEPGKPTPFANSMAPDRAWRRYMAERLVSFPGVRYWELDNEYDLNKDSAEVELATDWQRYRNHHRAFGEIVRAVGGGELRAVENGRAGIWPDRIRACVASGDFDGIDVVNVHHYTGVEPPESSFGDMNTGFDQTHRQQPPALFFDRLRDTVRAAKSDGKPRDAFLTEFGWDTLAGQIVTPRQQAAYLARGFMLSRMAGITKSFWFYNYDSATPSAFFDGCGLLGPVEQGAPPKLSLNTMAGLAWLLPSPEPVGQITAGPDTAGYVFRQDDQLVAALFTVNAEQGPEVEFAAGQLYDAFANPLPGRRVRLSPMPIYVVGLSAEDPFFLQTAYGLNTHHLVLATAGGQSTAELEVRNNRSVPLACEVRVVLPEGWTTATPTATASGLPNGALALPFEFTLARSETLGEREVRFEVREGTRLVKTIALRVLVQDAVTLQVGPIQGRPGPAKVNVKILNRTNAPLDGTLRLKLPATWQATPAEYRVTGLTPETVRDVEVGFVWSAGWGAGERAEVEFVADGSGRATQPLIPNTFRIPRAGKLVLDGDLGEWPAAALLPEWMVGSSLGAPRTQWRVAWAEDGLYFAARVADSVVKAGDPRSFWAGDCMELFLDTHDDKRHRFFELGDHQFWFVPLLTENRVYGGQWKRKEEIAATRYDLPNIRSAARREGDGYVMEFFLPAAHLQGYAPKVGGRLGLCLNLTVNGQRFQRQVYWPWTKDWSVQNLPKTWGSVELGE